MRMPVWNADFLVLQECAWTELSPHPDRALRTWNCDFRTQSLGDGGESSGQGLDKNDIEMWADWREHIFPASSHIKGIDEQSWHIKSSSDHARTNSRFSRRQVPAWRYDMTQQEPSSKMRDLLPRAFGKMDQILPWDNWKGTKNAPGYLRSPSGL